MVHGFLLQGFIVFFIAQGLFKLHGFFMAHGLHGLWLPADAVELIIPALITNAINRIITLFILLLQSFYSAISRAAVFIKSVLLATSYSTNEKPGHVCMAGSVTSGKQPVICHALSWRTGCRDSCFSLYHMDCVRSCHKDYASSLNTGYVSSHMGCTDLPRENQQMPVRLTGPTPVTSL